MEIKADIRRYILETFLTDGNNIDLNDATPLITGVLFDSIGMLGLVRFIERRFGIEFMPKEVDAERLDTIEAIMRLFQGKLESAPR